MKSKRIALFLVFCLTALLPIGAAAQEAVVRQWEDNPSATVSYVERGGEHQFVYADASMAAKDMAIDPRYEVYDFVVGKNRVYFCGKDNATQRGLFGWFEANPKRWGAAGYYVYSSFYRLGALDVQSLDRLVLIDESDSVRLAVVGHGADSSYCILRIAGAQPLAGTGWVYTSGNTSVHDQTVNRICMAGNHIATLGFVPGNKEFCLRIYDANNLFALDGIQEEVYAFPISDFETFSFKGLSDIRLSGNHHRDYHYLFSSPFLLQHHLAK